MTDKGLTAGAALVRVWGGKIPTEEEVRLFIAFDDAYEDYIERRLFHTLANGAWRATGYRLPGGEREEIPPNYWSFLNIDFMENTASRGEFEFVGLRLHENKAKPRLISGAEDKCFMHLAELMRAKKIKGRGGYHTKVGYRTKMRADIKGLSGKAFDRAWKKAVHEPTSHPTWGQPGGF